MLEAMIVVLAVFAVGLSIALYRQWRIDRARQDREFTEELNPSPPRYTVHIKPPRDAE